MKKRTIKVLCVLLSFIFIVAACPVGAFAGDGEEKIINLKVNDGEDIAEEFTKAAREAKDDNSGRIYKLIVPAGNYTAGSQLKVWSNTYVYLDGVTIRHTDTGSNMFRFGNKSDLDKNPVNGYNGFSNIHIEGGTFDGGGLSNSILQIGHCRNITINKCTFCNVKNTHMVEMGGCSDVKITNCVFKNFIGSWTSQTNYEALQFEVVTKSGNHFSGYSDISDETPCRNITVSGCTFNNLQRGIGTHTGIVNSYFSNMKFENNKFSNITGYAIIATNYTGSSIKGNSIKNCGSGIYFRTVELAHSNFYPSSKKSNSHPKYINAKSNISNNTIEISGGYKGDYKNVAYGIQLAGEKLSKQNKTVPKGDFRCSGVNVSSNKIKLNCTGYGIWLIGSIKNSVKSNTIERKISKKGKGGTGDGIRLQKSAENTISSNTLKNSTKNKSINKNINGISLMEGSSSNKVNSNKIEKSGKNGIHLDNSHSNTLNNNSISSSGKNGIAFYKSKKNIVSGNKIKSSKSYGIYSSLSKKNTVKKYKKNKITKSGKKAYNWK